MTATIRGDGYQNNVTSLGSSRDKSYYTFFGRDLDLTSEQLESMYEREAIASRVVDRVVDDATRVDFTLEGTDESFDWGSIKSELGDIDARNKLGDGWRWARLYGGSLIVMNIDDNMPLDRPLAINRATKIRSLEIFESRFVLPSFGKHGLRNPESYTISNPHGKITKIHSSRTIRFDGVRTAPTRMLSRGGWGPSVLDKVWRDLRRLGTAMGYAESILHEISVMMLSIKGYRTQMAGTEKDRRTAQLVFQKMREGIDTLNTLILDADDSYTESTRTTAGLSDLLTQFVDGAVRATDMPRTILLGEQPGGLNASADGEVRAWYDHVSSQQKRFMTPALDVIIGHLFDIRKNRGEKTPTEWTIVYEPLWQPTEKERAETCLINAKTAQIQETLGVVAPDEIREQMIARGEIEPLTTTTPDDELPPIDPGPDDGPIEIPEAAPPLPGAVPIDLAPTDLAAVVTVDEARASQGLPPWPNPEEGRLTLSEFRSLGSSRGEQVGEVEGSAVAP